MEADYRIKMNRHLQDNDMSPVTLMDSERTRASLAALNCVSVGSFVILIHRLLDILSQVLQLLRVIQRIGFLGRYSKGAQFLNPPIYALHFLSETILWHMRYYSLLDT